jgi:hypothetical protein
MYKTILLVSVVLTSLSAQGLAAENIKPGLWEISVKSDAMPSMPKLSSEQLAQMKKMGVQMPQMRGGAMISKVCITKEMATREPMSGADKNAGCESRNYQRSGANYSGDIVCKGPDLVGQGKIKGSFSGREAFSSSYEFKGSAHGQPVEQRHDSAGKWLAADCGDIKPMDHLAGAR